MVVQGAPKGLGADPLFAAVASTSFVTSQKEGAMRRSIVAVTIVMFVGAGCASSFKPEPPTFGTDQIRVLQAKYKATDPLALYDEQTKDVTDPRERKRIRNRIIREMMVVIDYNYAKFEQKLYSDHAIGDFSFDLTTVALGLAGTLSTGTKAQTALAAATAAVAGTKLAVDADFFQKQNVIAIASKMQELREKQRVVLIRRMSRTTVDSYPLEAALQDVVTFYEQGTVLAALEEITKQAKAEADKAKGQQDAARDQNSIVKDMADALNAAKPVPLVLNDADGKTITFNVIDAKWDDPSDTLTLKVKLAGAQNGAAKVKVADDKTQAAIRDGVVAFAKAKGVTIDPEKDLDKVTFKLKPAADDARAAEHIDAGEAP
jgi:hypothetical protein